MTTRRDEVIVEILHDKLDAKRFELGSMNDDQLRFLAESMRDALLERFCVISSHDYCAPHVSWWHADCETSCNKCMHCGRTREEGK